MNPNVAIILTGTNGHVTYGRISGEGFNIDPVTGVITTAKALDRETQEYYTLTGMTLTHLTASSNTLGGAGCLSPSQRVHSLNTCKLLWIKAAK